jgi:glycopeptide antibiotics resistance protein
MQHKKRFFSPLLKTFFLLFILLSILYFSWIPDTSLHSESYLPSWLVDWSNQHYNLRTAVPFIFLGFLLETKLLLPPTPTSPFCSITIRILHLGIAFLVVVVAELGQFCCNRHPDILDVIYGLLGSIAGGLVYYLFRKTIQFIST